MEISNFITTLFIPDLSILNLVTKLQPNILSRLFEFRKSRILSECKKRADYKTSVGFLPQVNNINTRTIIDSTRV